MQGKKLSLYSEPYYPPGYCGYTPQFNFQFGDTYGKTTSRLLKDGSVSKSRKSVLVELFPEQECDNEDITNENDCTRLKRLSWGDHKLTHKMVPGYTGYIPSGEHHFGSRYAQICDNAVSQFHHNQRIAHQERLKNSTFRKKPPLVRKQEDSAPYVSINQTQHSISPYLMSEHDPDKTFMSGYTGFIPRSRPRFALGYSRLTKRALQEFTREQQSFKANAMVEVDVSGSRPPVTKERNSRAQAHSIYVKNGLLPQYTGYLPGHKFRFGDTYGTSARYFHSTKCSD